MILVVGATGIVGGMITRQLLEQGKTVRILVRKNSPSEQLWPQGMATSAQSLIDAGAKPVYGDMRDPASLARAVQDITTVITTANSALRSGEDNVENVDRRGNRSLIEAAATAGVQHFIFISVLGVSLDGPDDFMRAKAESEVLLQESGMDYTILAPDAFMEIWPGLVVGMPALSGQPVTLVGEGRRKHSFISNRDVTAFAVAAVDLREARNQHLPMGGPAALSYRDVVATYEKVLGREIEVHWVAPGTPIPGLPGPMPMMLAGMEAYDSILSTDELAAQYGLTLTSLEDVVRRQTGIAATA